MYIYIYIYIIYIYYIYIYIIQNGSVINEYLECIFLEVKTRSKKENKITLFGVVYIPPNTNINVF